MSNDRIPESHMRLFFAVPLPPSLAARIAGWRDALRLPRLAAPVPASNMHITLAFLGDVPRDQVPALLNLGARVARREARGELVLDRVHCWRSGVLHLAPSAKRDVREGRHRNHSDHDKPQPSLMNRSEPHSESNEAVTVPLDSTHSSSPASPLSVMGYTQSSPSPTEATLPPISPTRSINEPPRSMAVHALAAALTAELEAEGVPFDKREFSAHLTLARRAERVRARARFHVPVTSLVLYVSQTDERGVAYTALGEWQLRGDGMKRMSAEGGVKGKAKAAENSGGVGQVGTVGTVGEGRERSGSCMGDGTAADGRKEGQPVDVDSVGEVDTELRRILGISDSSAASGSRPP